MMGLPLHPFWLITVLVIVFIIVLPVVLLVSGAVSANRRAGGPPAYGLRSPDGRWWWDGHQWQPVPPANGDR